MLVANALLIHSHTLDGKDLILFAKPPAVQLVVWHDPKEQYADTRRQQSSDKKDNLPGLDDSAGPTATDRNAVGKAATEDLCPTVEAEPDGCT